MKENTTDTKICPCCGQPALSGLSASAKDDLEYARNNAGRRGGYIWEAARTAYEEGTHQDNNLKELLESGFLRPHPDPLKGYVVT